MRLRDNLIRAVCIILAVLFVTAAGLQLDYINSRRAEMQLIRNEPLENAPPSLAFATVAMGAFRGLIVDVLWLRAEALKDEGQFFDAKQLAEWITTLQPRFAAVWEFHAWNMAYNISVAIPATQPDQRWRWVKNGYELLRDRGIPLNPRSIRLYRQLALIFQHKMGAVTDDAHRYYKLQLALVMQPLLQSADNHLEATNHEYYKALSESPKEWEQVAKDPNISQLISALQSADAAFKDTDKFADNYLSLRKQPGRFAPATFETIDRFRGTDVLKKFDIFAKAWHLHHTWKLEPALMDELNHSYGPIEYRDPNIHLPLDWRHPDTHAIYWAVRGLEVAGEKEVLAPGKYSIDEMNTDRIVAHSLQNLFRSGKIFIYDYTTPEPNESGKEMLSRAAHQIFLRSDLRMFESYNQAILKIINKYTDPNGDELNTHQNGHRNMLTNAMLSFYQAGHTEYARKIFNQLRTLYPRPEFEVSFVTFARNEMREQLRYISYYDAREMIQMMLRESYFCFAMRDDNRAAHIEKLASDIHERYQTMYLDENRIDLPLFVMLRYFALMDFLADPQYPLTLRRGLLARIELEKPELYKKLLDQEDIIKEQQK